MQEDQAVTVRLLRIAEAGLSSKARVNVRFSFYPEIRGAPMHVWLSRAGLWAAAGTVVDFDDANVFEVTMRRVGIECIRKGSK